MDKIVEQKIREFAFNYVGTMIQSQHPYVFAARDGAITFDDIFFLGAVEAAQSQTLQALVEMNQAPVREEIIGSQKKSFVEQDNPDFRHKITTVGYSLLAEMYACSPQDAEKRFENIQERVTEYHNTKVKRRKIQ